VLPPVPVPPLPVAALPPAFVPLLVGLESSPPQPTATVRKAAKIPAVVLLIAMKMRLRAGARAPASQ
jgi:hypothetical protein